VLEPLGPEHNEDDHEAWSSSIEHIRATPGFLDGRWPSPMTLEENRADGVHDAVVTSWVRATHEACDPALRELVSRWLVEAWPFDQISYAGPA
jgi:hypothetical protein